MSAPADIRAKLAMLRESFLHSGGVQDWIGDWWNGLKLDDRRTLLALAGLDESKESARRPWRQHLQQDRDCVLAECKRIGKLIEALRWA